MRLVSAATSLSAVLALAGLAKADCTPFTVQYSKPLFDVGEHSFLTVTGTPGNPFVVLFDPVPGPTAIPGIGVFGVGFSPALYIEFAPKMAPEGVMNFSCNFGCGSPPVGVPYYTQAVSIDPATLTICFSNVAVLNIQDLTGKCEPHGCTPGYWKNHLTKWAETDYSTGDDFDATFGTSHYDPDLTLGDVIATQEGVDKNLPYHGVAALLNASHAGVTNYPYTVDEVKALVSAAINSGDRTQMEAAKNQLAAANELGCPF